jgi:hypothetical protein
MHSYQDQGGAVGFVGDYEVGEKMGAGTFSTVVVGYKERVRLS